MPSTNDHAPRARRKARPPHIPLSFAGVQVLVVVLALFAGSVATTYALSAEFGNSVRGLEALLALLALGGHSAVAEGEAVVVGVALLALSGWRYWHNGSRLNASVVALPIALVVIAASMKYAHFAGETGMARHARQMADAVGKAERTQLRELVFACEAFCGFHLDSGPLVWLVGVADSTADYNAIGRMLTLQADRGARSSWLADRRSALEVAVDRYATEPSLAPYVLGFGSESRFYFMVPGASAEEMNAALFYAVARRAPAPLIRALVAKGASPQADVRGSSALERARADVDDPAGEETIRILRRTAQRSAGL